CPRRRSWPAPRVTPCPVSSAQPCKGPSPYPPAYTDTRAAPTVLRPEYPVGVGVPPVGGECQPLSPDCPTPPEGGTPTARARVGGETGGGRIRGPLGEPGGAPKGRNTIARGSAPGLPPRIRFRGTSAVIRAWVDRLRARALVSGRAPKAG